MKKRKILALALSLCLMVNGAFILESSAAEAGSEKSSESLSDENQYREITIMDENGNITESEDFDGKFPESEVVDPTRQTRSRSARSSSYVVNFNTKSNDTTSYTEAATGKAGYTNGDYGADAAYLGTSGGKVKFMMSGVVGLVNSSEVQIISVDSAKVISGYEVSNGRLLHGIVCDMTTPGYNTKLDNGKAPSYLKAGVKYYSYDGHYFYTDYATMLSDYQNNTRSNSVNPKSPYYNYYQYLPMRTVTSYSSSTLSSMINSRSSSSSKMYNTGNSFVNNQNTYGVNALLMTGIAANESAWGSSSIAKNKNNLFGLNAVDSSPGTSSYTYASVDVCIKDFANGWMSRGYLNPKDWRYFGGFLGNKASGLNVKYASDPFWGEKAANIAYSLDKSGGSKDYDKYTIGIKDTIATSDKNNYNDVNVRKEASTASGSSVLYSTGSSASYSVVCLNSETKNSFYKIQSDAVLNSSRTGVNSSSGNYSFDSMYAYIHSDYVIPVNSGTDTSQEPDSEPATLSSIKITTPPEKTVYTEGDKFNASGMKVTAIFSDGSTEDVTSKVTYTDQALKITDTDITISYKTGNVTKTAVQTITVKEKAEITSVKVNPAEITLEQGEQKTFGVSVAGKGDFSTEVEWSVSGNKSENTVIDDNGKLTISSDESAESVTIKAVSKEDSSKSASVIVTIKKKTGEEQKPSDKPQTPDEPNIPEVPDATETEKDELKDNDSGITLSGNFSEGAKLNVTEITAESMGDSGSIISYEDIIKTVADKVVLGVYEISLEGTFEDSITLTFKVEDKYEGWNATVLHYTEKASSEGDQENEVSEDVYKETYESTVKDGVVAIQVDSLSPFVLAVEDPDKENSGGDNTEGTVTDESDSESDQTIGDTNENSQDDVNSGETTKEDKEGNGIEDTDETKAQNATQDKDKSAETGDSFPITILVMVAVIAVLCIIGILLSRKFMKK